jgi:asparagine synthase (glutamine-hydrolysing)
MRRLAIFDPANGHQPMETPDGRYSIVFNGAIYNFQTLQTELEAVGWTFRTRCDTEVLLAALAQWGEDAIGRLRGMFAFALLDSVDGSLLIARDPFGIKPLYFAHKGGRLVFASEVAALVASGAADMELDPISVADYLGWLTVPAPRTIYRGISSLKPGEKLRFSGGGVDIKPIWSYATIPRDGSICSSRDDFIHGIRERLEESIKAHLLADVPVGAFVSGGLDSAIVVGLMSRASGNVLKTFSIAFEEDDFSEADDAEANARHFGAIHHTRILTGEEVARDIDRLMEACDQPTGDGINTYYASQTAQQGGVRVALSGLGGDELFGGYPSFRAVPTLSNQLARWNRVPESLRRLVTKSLKLGGTRAMKLSDLLSHAVDPHQIAALNRRVFSKDSQLSILAPEISAQIRGMGPFHPELDHMRKEIGSDHLYSLVSAWETRTYMADVLLRDSDFMSMRNSIELRVPFVDRPLIEWLWRQPDRFKDDRRHPKAALAEATADLLPPGLLQRKKRGFTLPFSIWMRRELRPFLEDTFCTASVSRSGLLSVAPVQNLWNGFLNGNDDRQWSRVWSLAVLVAFLNRRPVMATADDISTYSI